MSNFLEVSTAVNQNEELIDVLCKFLECNKNESEILEKMITIKHDILKYLKKFDLVDHLDNTVEIDEITELNATQHKFLLKSQTEEKSVENYFKEKYDIKLNFPRLPLLKIGEKKFIPIEVCKLGLSRRSNLTKDEQAKMVSKIFH